MLTITCYGAVNEIGGNKLLLEDSGSALMLDFGKSFSAEGSFFDEFLQPRTNSCLRDLLKLGLLPPISGIYRHDLLTHAGAWNDVSERGLPPTTRRLFEAEVESYDDYTDSHGARIHGVLLSHAHTDHCQHLSYLDRRIPVYCSGATYAILRAAEDIGKGGFESNICECPRRVVTVCSDRSTFPGEINIAQDHSDCARAISVVEGHKVFDVAGFRVEPIPVDHSVPGAFAYLITAPSGKTVFYTGDIRFHGRFSDGPTSLTASLRGRTRQLRPDILITEGTRVESSSGDSETDVEKGMGEAVAGCSGLAIVDFGWKDTTRFQTVLNVAKATGRTVALSPKVAYLWSLLREMEPDAWPELSEDDTIRVYLKRTDSMTYSLADYSKSKHLAGVCTEWGRMRDAYTSGDADYLERRLCHYYHGVRASDIAEKPSDYILHAGYFDMNELLDVNPPQGSVFIRAATEPFSDEMILDERKLERWLDFFSINDGAGIIREHVSGHANGSDLLEFISDMNPGVVIPIHTEHAEVFVRGLAGRADVIVPELGVAIPL